MDYKDLMEINFGLILTGVKSVQEYRPEDFSGDWGKAIKIMQKKGASKEDAAKVLGPSCINAATHSIDGWNGSREALDWPKQLREAKAALDLSKEYKRMADALEQNEEVDLLPLHGKTTSFLAGRSSGLTLAKDMDYNHYVPFMESGYAPIDSVIGGYPTDGPIVVFGSQGTGKSFYSANAMSCLLNHHKQKNGAIYTLEMSAEHYLYRSVNMYPKMKDVLDRLYVSGSVRGVEELVSEVTTKRLDFVVVDDMDRMVKSVDPGAYQITYFRLAEICRFLKIPVMILAQPNRAAKIGKQFMDAFDISWSSAGENSAAMLIALQKANAVDLEDDKYPLTDDDKYFMIFLKSRDGWPMQHGPGAIRLDNANKNQLWSGDAYQGRLWTPGSASKSRKIKGGQ